MKNIIKKIAIYLTCLTALLSMVSVSAQTTTKTLKLANAQQGSISGASKDSVLLWRKSDSTVRSIALDSMKGSPFYLAGGLVDAYHNKTGSIYRTGNLGIGISNPITTLHIQNTLAATNNVNANAQVLRLSRPSTLAEKWDNISQFNLGSYAVAGPATDDAFTRLDLAMNNGPSLTTSNIMTWQANGRVGINTTAPGYHLEVVGKGKFSDSLLGTTALFSALSPGSSADSVVTIDASGNLKKRSAKLYGDTTTLSNTFWNLSGNAVTAQKILGTTTNFDLPIYTNNTEKLRIKTNGNVGIGITNPITTLHIQNPLLATDNVNADAQILRLTRPQTSGVKWDNVAQFNLGSYQVESTNKSAKSRLDLVMNDAGSLATSNIMTWQANGRVGINTTAPGYHLEVVGKGKFSDSLLGTTALFSALSPGSSADSIVTVDASGNLKKRSATLLVDTANLNKTYWSLTGNALTTQRIL